MLTVITPATNTRLTTIGMLKSSLGITSTDDDDYLTRLIVEASDYVSKYCNRVFARETVAETFRLTEAQSCLILSRYPVTTITSVVEDGVTLAATDYELDDTSLLYRLWSDVRDDWIGLKIVVTYTGGYTLPGVTTPTLPADLEAAVVDRIKHVWHSRGRDPGIKSETTPGVYEVVYSGTQQGYSMPAETEDRIKRYRDVKI